MNLDVAKIVKFPDRCTHKSSDAVQDVPTGNDVAAGSDEPPHVPTSCLMVDCAPAIINPEWNEPKSPEKIVDEDTSNDNPRDIKPKIENFVLKQKEMDMLKCIRTVCNHFQKLKETAQH